MGKILGKTHKKTKKHDKLPSGLDHCLSMTEMNFFQFQFIAFVTYSYISYLV